MSNNITKSGGDAVSEKQEKNTGKLVGGGVAAVIGGVIGALLLGGYAILPAAIVVGLFGVALGSVFD
jgi:predicted benzoate:H+ symporter BenE